MPSDFAIRIPENGGQNSRLNDHRTSSNQRKMKLVGPKGPSKSTAFVYFFVEPLDLDQTYNPEL